MSTLKIALVQFNPVWENTSASLQKLEITLQAIKKDTQLVILPEMFNTGFSMNPQKIAEDETGLTYQFLKKWSTQFTICGSFATKVDKGFVNRLYVFEQSNLIGQYDKKYLFGLGKEDQHYQAGTDKLTLQIKDFKCTFYICYDLRFPEWLRNTNDTDAIVLVASWPEKRIEHWDTLLKARAIENQYYVLASNRVGDDGNDVSHCGHSQIIAPNGDVIEKLSETEGIVYSELDKTNITFTRRALPFLKDIKP